MISMRGICVMPRLISDSIVGDDDDYDDDDDDDKDDRKLTQL